MAFKLEVVMGVGDKRGGDGVWGQGGGRWGLGTGGEEMGFGGRGGGDGVWGQGLLGIAGDCWGLPFLILLVTEHSLVASSLVIILQYFLEMIGGGIPLIQYGEGYFFRFFGFLDQHL
jgi:hypothetical protein